LEAATAAGHDRFVFTSTTSLMVTEAIRAETQTAAVWMDERFGPPAPRNIYGVSKLAAEHLCRMYAQTHEMGVIALRTSRFFPEEDDTLDHLSGENLKANEFLYRRLSAVDAARAHVAALAQAPGKGYRVYLVSAPTPFAREDAAELRADARAVIRRHFPEAEALYRAKGWALPAHISRVYNSSLIQRELGFRFQTDFAAILGALQANAPLPFDHDPGFVSPVTQAVTTPI
jgi:nucleoside-diphosphate-sugar epimerase